MSKFDVGPARPLQQDTAEREDGRGAVHDEHDEFPGLERLDRDELDEDDGDG